MGKKQTGVSLLVSTPSYQKTRTITIQVLLAAKKSYLFPIFGHAECAVALYRPFQQFGPCKFYSVIIFKIKITIHILRLKL